MITPVFSENPAEDIWNFAIGSNMHPDKLRGRANLVIRESCPAKLQDWRLAFNLRGISWLEPSMAGVEPAPGETVHGVLVRLSPGDFEKLVQSEGGDQSYESVAVEVETYCGKSKKAFVFRALESRRLSQDRPPTLRYLDLIRTGARLNGLAPEYIEKLDALPHYQKGPITNLISKLIFEMAMCFGCLGVPQLMVLLFRTLRWIDESLLPSVVKGVFNALVLVPVLSVASALRIRYLFPKESKRG
jgi:hypothetical protein